MIHKIINSSADKTQLMINGQAKSKQVIETSFRFRKLWIILPVLFISTISNSSSVEADHGKEFSCSDMGYIDGQNHPFNQGTYDRCGEDYYQGFIQGCMSVAGNFKETCESATDA